MQLLSSSAGPLLSVALFLVLGNEWKVRLLSKCAVRWHAELGLMYADMLQVSECKVVLLLGLVLQAPSLIVMFMFNDDLALKSDSEPVSRCQLLAARGRLCLALKMLPACTQYNACYTHCKAEHSRCKAMLHNLQGSAQADISWRRPGLKQTGRSTQHPASEGSPQCCCGASPRFMAATLILTSDLIAALACEAGPFVCHACQPQTCRIRTCCCDAAGMTMKFFSLFFIEACMLGPVQVSLLGTAGLLCISAASIAVQAISVWYAPDALPACDLV